MLLPVLALGILLYAAGAGAQLTATLAGVSDYRFRGVSLSRQKPAAQFTVGYDDPNGWYGGVFGSTVDVAGQSATTQEAVVFLGVVRPAGGGYHWDVGWDYSAFSGDHGYDYGAVYIGIASQSFDARVHYSRDYFGVARGAFYAEINGTHPVGERLVLLAHVGVLVPVGEGNAAGMETVRNPLDLRVGIGGDIAGCSFQLAWVGTDGIGPAYPVYGGQRRNAVVLSASRSF